ncbi:hypothetical protein [Streptomyces sp. NPDC001380]|uniref:hypothetical protein n=1 Tax=Streptomyces sp. NPDC001380 TaxID=3364566 RepID=UPI0036811691
MITPPPARADLSCPSCGAPLPTDTRFVAWCPSCDWDVDPGGSAAAQDVPAGRSARREEARRRAGHLAVERLYADVSAEPDRRPGRDRALLSASALAGAVHLVTAVLAGAPCGCWSPGTPSPARSVRPGSSSPSCSAPAWADSAGTSGP